MDGWRQQGATGRHTGASVICTVCDRKRSTGIVSVHASKTSLCAQKHVGTRSYWLNKPSRKYHRKFSLHTLNRKLPTGQSSRWQMSTCSFGCSVSTVWHCWLSQLLNRRLPHTFSCETCMFWMVVFLWQVYPTGTKPLFAVNHSQRKINPEFKQNALGLYESSKHNWQTNLQTLISNPVSVITSWTKLLSCWSC